MSKNKEVELAEGYREAYGVTLDFAGEQSMIEKYTSGNELLDYDGTINLIEVKIVAPHLVELRLHIEDEDGGYIQEISYSGDFLVVWSVSEIDESQ